MSARDVLANTYVITSPDGVQLNIGCELADTIISALSAAGYAIVPVEPTDEMHFSFCQPDSPAGEDMKSLWKRRYKAMLAAAKGE